MLGARMKIKRHYLTAEEIPAEARGFYTQSGEGWRLDLEERTGGDVGGGRVEDGKGTASDPANQRPREAEAEDGPKASPGPAGQPIPSAVPATAVPRAQMTLRQLAAAQDADRALLRTQAEVRKLAQQLGATPKGVEQLLQRAQETFRVVGGRVQAVGTDGRTLLRAADGDGGLTVAEWARRQVTASPELFAGRPGGGFVEPELTARNPFKKRHWNLTEQMRLTKQDPERAARLKRGAWEEGA